MYHTNLYIQAILNIDKSQKVLDEVEQLFIDNNISYQRVKDLRAIGEDYNLDYYGEEE